jgi:hypothetical protein
MATVHTNAGKAIVTNRMIGAGTEPKWIGMGTGTTAAAVTDTVIETEVETRAVGVSSRVTTTLTNDTYRTVGTITATATRAVANAGSLDALSGGNLNVHGDFAVINLALGDSIQFTIDNKFA